MKVIIIRPSSVKNNLPAIISNAPDNSIIRIMAGTYKFDKPIIIKNKHNITIYGIGKVNLVCTKESVKIIQIINSKNIKLVHLYVSHIERYRHCAPGEDVVYLKNSRNITIDKCSLNGTGFIGVHAIKTKYLYIENSKLYYNTYLGAYFKSCKGIFIKNNYLYTNELGGIKIDNSNLIKIISNRINNNGNKYINMAFYISDAKCRFFGIKISKSKDIIISKNEIFNHDWGIHLEKCNPVKIIKNRIFDNSKAPVYVKKSKPVIIINNVIESISKIKKIGSRIKIINNQNRILFGPRVYQREKNAGIITGRVVNVRNAPRLSSRVIATVKEHDKVFIISKGTYEFKIGRFKAYWYKIKTIKGKIGYLFGAFLFPVNKIFKTFNFDFDRAHYMMLILRPDYKYTYKIHNRYNQEIIRQKKGSFIIRGRRLSFNPGFEYKNYGHKIIKYLYLHTESKIYKKNKYPVANRYPQIYSNHPLPKHRLSFSLLPTYIRFKYGFW